MKIFVDDKVDETDWNKLMKQSSFANFFQSKSCYDFYSELSFVEPFVFGVTENNSLKGVIVGYIQKDGGKLKQFLSRRAIIIGGALLDDNISNKALSELLKHCKKVLKGKAIYIECRNFNDYHTYKKLFQQNGFEYVPHLNFYIDCSSEEIMNTNLGKSRKRDIKTSLRDGAFYTEAVTLEEVREYYRILEDLYITKVKTPLFPFEFFEKLYYHSFSKFLLIKLGKMVIGGTVCVTLKDRAVYEWFACGRYGVYKNVYPSTLATYSGIKYACEKGFPRFDMMGAGKPDESYGVRDFKAKFGGELVEHGRFLCVINPILYMIGKMGIRLLKAVK